jgi:hypothetical protein
VRVVIGSKDFLFVEPWMAKNATTTTSREEPQEGGGAQARTKVSKIESTGKQRWVDKCERVDVVESSERAGERSGRNFDAEQQRLASR